MIKYWLLLICCFGLITAWAQHPNGFRPGWLLVESHEFNGDQVDSVWDNKFPWGPYVAGSAYNTPDGNRQVEDGLLTLTAKKEHYRGEVWDWDEEGNFTPYERDFEYTSGMLYHRKGYRHGLFETRFKAAKGQGLLSAFWLYGNDNEEIDVFEIRGSKTNEAQMTLHWKDRDPFTGTKQSADYIKQVSPTFSDAFHTFGVSWTDNALWWQLDGDTVDMDFWTRFIRERHIPVNRLHPILSIHVGVLDGEPQDSSVFPANFDVDYARMYRNDTLVDAPVVFGQDTLFYTPGEWTQIPASALAVADVFGFYPLGHRLELGPGEKYQAETDSVWTDLETTDTLYIPVRINNGQSLSEAFTLVLFPDRASTVVENNRNMALRISRGYLLGNMPFREIHIYSGDGQRVWQYRRSEPTVKVALPALPAGLYIIRTQSQQGMGTLKWAR